MRMLASLSGDIGVVLFTNTSLEGEGMKSYNGLFEDLWKAAEAMKGAGDRQGASSKE